MFHFVCDQNNNNRIYIINLNSKKRQVIQLQHLERYIHKISQKLLKIVLRLEGGLIMTGL